jgi:hypothetical protein
VSMLPLSAAEPVENLASQQRDCAGGLQSIFWPVEQEGSLGEACHRRRRLLWRVGGGRG